MLENRVTKLPQKNAHLCLYQSKSIYQNQSPPNRSNKLIPEAAAAAYSYLTEADIKAINGSFVNPVNVINQGNLDEAVNGPGRVLFGHAVYPTLVEKAAHLVISLSQGHPFGDGNKRTAATALSHFIKKNRSGRDLTKSPNYLVGQVAENPPMTRAVLITALGKLIPAREGIEPANI